MSAQSRALHALADHMERLRDGAAGDLDPGAPPVYNSYWLWDCAADMARRTAAEQTWRARIPRWTGRHLPRAITARHRQ